MNTSTIYAAVTFCCMVTLYGIQAQDSSREGHATGNDYPAYFSTIPHVNAYMAKEEHVYLNSISTKAVADFKQRYKKVDDEIWYTKTRGFVASFKKDGIYWIISYDQKGKWESCVKGYAEDKMIFEVRDIVKRTYYDYSISHVDEIETLLSNGVPTYLVYIQFRNETKIIRVKENEMSIWKEMKDL